MSIVGSKRARRLVDSSRSVGTHKIVEHEQHVVDMLSMGVRIRFVSPEVSGKGDVDGPRQLYVGVRRIPKWEMLSFLTALTDLVARRIVGEREGSDGTLSYHLIRPTREEVPAQ